MAGIKEKLYNKSMEIVGDKIAIAEGLMKDAQQSANNEEKSTAGDKFDTARAMSQIERDMYAKQLNEAATLKKILINLSINHTSETAEAGSLVITPSGEYFISVGLGKVTLEGKDYLVISPISPIGQQLIGKAKGDSFLLQGKQVEIINVQ